MQALFGVCWFFLAAIALAQGQGVIQGLVVNEEGTPIAEAKVHAEPLDGRTRGTLVRYVETDAQGRFRIDRLEWGKYMISAKKEESGYPDMMYAFYNNNLFTTVTLSQLSPLADVRIQLGPQAGVLTGTITDAESGNPVNAGFRFTPAERPNNWLSKSAPPRYRVLLPAREGVFLEVTAPGYKKWHYGGTPSAPKGIPLRLASGAEMVLDIRLEPAPGEAKIREQAASAVAGSPLLSRPAPNPGAIGGMVVDKTGKPVSQAWVKCMTREGHFCNLSRGYVETDANGRFVMEHLPWGEYRVYAMKEESGYPNITFPIYRNDSYAAASLGPQHPKAEILLKLGPKAAVLTGWVRDGVTGKPVNAFVVLRPVDYPDDWLSIATLSRRYRALAPPSTDLNLEVVAEGYQTWYYGGPSDPLHRKPLRLDSGTEITLDIALKPQIKNDK